MITPTMAITEMTARTMSNIFMDLFMGYGMQRNEKIRNPSLRPNCGMIRLPIVLCNWFTLLPYQPPEPEQTDGISHHNQALRPIWETGLCGTYDTGHQHHMVEQCPEEEPQDIHLRKLQLTVQLLQRPDADGQAEEDGVEQAGVVAAEVDGLHDMHRAVDEFENGHTCCHPMVTFLRKHSRQRSDHPYQ